MGKRTRTSYSANTHYQADQDAMMKRVSPLLIAFAVLGVLFFIWAGSYPTVGRDSEQGNEMTVAMRASLGLGLVAWVILMLDERLSFGRQGCALAGLLLFVTVFPIWYMCTNLAVALNGALDRSAAQTFHTQVLRKSVTRSKSSVSHLLTVQDWKERHSAVTIRVSAPVFDQVASGRKIKVQTKLGALGIEWVVRYSLR